ncbi:MAG TPA: exodeoxyribonuclease III [Candidatus Saccharibacteria bacterium]|jgi:exodeoxyribonuclease-3|nr:exodeoxyribonuclease III [Candidatus Saccharibacteria bacterium]
MKIYSWNVNGIRAVVSKGALQAFIDQHQPDIIGLQETRAVQGQAEIDLAEYEEYWNSATKKGYSGTAIFTKIKPLSVHYDFPKNIASKYDFVDTQLRDSEAEGRVIATEYDKFIFVTVYTPNSKNDLSRLELRYKIWDPAFLEYVQHLDKIKPVVFCGDLNVAYTEDDLANPKQNVGKHGFTNEEREGFGRYLSAGFIDSFRIFTKGKGYYTWWTHWAHARERNVGWRIDYLMVSKKLKNKVKKAEIHPDVMGSDHCPISLELDL